MTGCMGHDHVIEDREKPKQVFCFEGTTAYLTSGIRQVIMSIVKLQERCKQAREEYLPAMRIPGIGEDRPMIPIMKSTWPPC